MKLASSPKQAFLDHHAVAGFAHAVAGEHGVDCGMRFFGGRRDHHALAGRQAVGLDHDGGAVRIDVGVRRGGIGEGAERGGGDAVTRHELLGEILGAFKLGGGLRRAEDLQPGGAERIDHARRQRRFGADHGEARCRSRGGQTRPATGIAVKRHVDEAVFRRRAAIAGRDENLGNAGGLRELPRQSVFASAGADDEEFHVELVSE